jgi:hypothetical protein
VSQAQVEDWQAPVAELALRVGTAPGFEQAGEREFVTGTGNAARRAGGGVCTLNARPFSS